jgi:hypothetical protein
MNFPRRVIVLAIGALALAAFGGIAPAARGAGVAVGSSAQQNAASLTLRKEIVTRFPKAAVQINRMGKGKLYAVVVTLVGQPNATLSGGSGAQVLAWYLAAFPHQVLYALYSYEKDRDGLAFWEYEYVPGSSVLRRYRFALGTTHTYPWYSWTLTAAGIRQAAMAGHWPKAVIHPAHAQPAAAQQTHRKK